jgi:hypothetical protein
VADDELIRAGHAREVLDSTIFKEAAQSVRSGIDAHMLRVPLVDQTMHTRLILLRQCWDQLERYLDQVRQTGEIKAFEIQQEEQRKRLFKVFG